MKIGVFNRVEDQWSQILCQTFAMRIVTWNLNTPFTKAESRIEQWKWIDNRLAADIAVLTEAEIPNSGLPDGWNAIYKQGGIGDTRRWGTIIASREGIVLRDITNGAEGKDGFALTHSRPGTVVVADILKKNKIAATLVGVYATTTDANGKKVGNGFSSLTEILEDLQPLFNSKRSKRLILAGDLNLLPSNVPDELYIRFCDAVLETEKTRWEAGYCCDCASDQMCGHMWTHWNRSVPNRIQNLDYVFLSKKLFIRLGSVTGGRRDFPDAELLSDHAPVVADFSF